ncbi:MAG: hypothetical protein QOD01_2978 [Actinomycetota bacterium]|jgi:hypothetical protein|nr:hypothetical protein [Actinomycetota bacterium]
MTALELRRVSKVYGEGPTEVQALRDIELSVDPGALVAVGHASSRHSAREQSASWPQVPPPVARESRSPGAAPTAAVPRIFDEQAQVLVCRILPAERAKSDPPRDCRSDLLPCQRLPRRH